MVECMSYYVAHLLQNYLCECCLHLGLVKVIKNPQICKKVILRRSRLCLDKNITKRSFPYVSLPLTYTPFFPITMENISVCHKKS